MRWPGRTVRTLVPMRWIWDSTRAWAPSPSATTEMTAATPMMMPSVVRMERMTLARMACMATPMISNTSTGGLPD